MPKKLAYILTFGEKVIKIKLHFRFITNKVQICILKELQKM